MRYFVLAILAGLLVYALAPWVQKFIVNPINKRLKKPYEAITDNTEEKKDE